jgi:transposase-like protein
MKDKSLVKTDRFSLRQFRYRFPDDDACLEELKVLRFGETLDCPSCGKNNKFYRIKNRKAYSCAFCRYQLYPLKGTIFEKSTTPLWDWFYAMYIMVQTRAGISAKQLERELGVTYKTAWRMFHQIRKLMADDGDMLTGEVEIDEAYFGGKGYWRAKERRDTDYKKQVVFGMVERKGRARVRHVPSSGTRALLPHIQKNIKPESQIYSDELGAYKLLGRQGYAHAVINHRRQEYAKGDVHTQNVENFWSNMKRGIRGVYRHVGNDYLQAYADEYSFRYSYRDVAPEVVFTTLLTRV